MTVVKLNIDTAGSRVKSFSLGLDRYHGGRPPRKRIVARDVPWLTRTYDNIAAGYPQSSCMMRRPRWTENVTEWRGNRRNRDPTIRPLISSRINARVPRSAGRAPARSFADPRSKFIDLHWSLETLYCSIIGGALPCTRLLWDFDLWTFVENEIFW